MRALLLAAGMGTRLLPLTETVPKCLVPIDGRPLLDYWFDLLFQADIERALINTSYLAGIVSDHIAKSVWRAWIDLAHESELLGTGGTVLANQSWFKRGPFLVIHADNLTDCDISALVMAHHRRPTGCAITMLTFRTDQPQLCGILELDQNGVVRAFHEKVPNPPGNLANGAVYVFEPDVLDYMANLGKPVIDLSTEVIAAFVGRIFTYEHPGYHRDIGNLASLEQAHTDVAKGLLRCGRRPVHAVASPAGR
jgi:mannose-1-phosphate guanylyltransferase